MDQEMLWAVVRLVIFFPLVTALAYFSVRYGVAWRRGFLGARRYMRVIEQLPLGPRAGFSLVQVGERYFLIAFHEGKLSLLKEFEQLPEELPAAAGQMENPRKVRLPGQARGFADFLKEKINLSRRKSEEAQRKRAKQDFLR